MGGFGRPGRTVPMTKLAVLLALGLAACADHSGAYLEVHGGSITFDHVEFYFGTHIGTEFGTPTQAHVTGLAFARQLADSDLAVAPKNGPSKEVTYYVPAANTDLGEYVMVIASLNNVPVGIGDAANFKVPTSGYSIVDITLEPYDTSVEAWQNGCIAWDRKHGEQPVAFVETDDHDCDGEVASRDCDDTAFCPPGDMSCQPPRELCTDNTCAYGCKINGNCVARVCVPSFTCTNAACLSSATLVDKFMCLAMASGADHPQYYVGGAAGNPCDGNTVDVKLPNNRDCAHPYLEFAEMGGGWTFSVADKGNGICTITVHGSTSGMPFGPDRHLLVSLDPMNSQDPRPTIFLGITSLSGGCTTSRPPDGTLVISDCQ
jgi:hypothetical protein